MAKMSYREALTETLHQEMANDENVIVMGEDVVGGTGSAGGPEAIGGVFGVTGGLFGKFGAERVIDMPISEAGIAGTAAGAALAGKRPVAEIMFSDFIFNGLATGSRIASNPSARASAIDSVSTGPVNL